MLRVTAPKLIL